MGILDRNRQVIQCAVVCRQIPCLVRLLNAGQVLHPDGFPVQAALLGVGIALFQRVNQGLVTFQNALIREIR